ncbi:MAG TPA: hypothetical protein GX708_21140 [Gallicola sp.]|nr:hypothetical protein [Gallicola sp.]
MARKIPSNLENVSKKSELNVEVFVDNKYSKFTHSFKIPFKILEDPITTHRTTFSVIDTFSDVIIDALEKRMESCMDMLNRNLFNVVESNEHHVMFKKENGSYHSFNHASFRIMQEAIRVIDERHIDRLRRSHYDQIIKALYWIEKPEQRNNISFGNLISACAEGMLTPLR